MTYINRLIIFILAAIIILIGVFFAQIWSKNNAAYIPKWPAIVALIGLYYYLFPKKINNEK
jgi:hypothetical protein